MGRWISRDPAQEEGGLNSYAFVSNNSINAIDLFGLDMLSSLEALDAQRRGQIVNNDHQEATPLIEKAQEWYNDLNSSLKEANNINNTKDMVTAYRLLHSGWSMSGDAFTCDSMGWEVHLIVGYGRFFLECCDGCQKRRHHYSKICLGVAAQISFSASVGLNENSDGKACKNPPPKILGVEFGSKTPIPFLGIGFGISKSLKDWKNSDAPTNYSVSGGPGYGYGAKASGCYYRLGESEILNENCSL